jgi:DNA-binding MltR family transcriptional regulator
MTSVVGKEAAELFSKYHAIISSESDRGAVILAGSILDVALEKLIVSFLLPPVKKEDKLVTGAYAPLGSFSAKIEMCYRLGLIKPQVLKQLQLFKNIRNDFAHRITDAELDSQENKNRMQEILSKTPEMESALLKTYSKNLEEHEIKKNNNNIISLIGVRHAFNTLVACMCMSLERVSLDTKRIEATQE